MKKISTAVMSIMLAVSLYSCASSQSVTNTYTDLQPAATITYQTFYDELSPYGSWIDYPGYGYVWSPSVADFQPYYTNGYWLSTDLGWNWNSNYGWGWAPFYYGRWFYETGYGWLWLPGYEWAPAWVCWRNNVDFYGWAPLAPGMDLGISISINIPFEHWTFVDHRFLADHNFINHCVDNNRKETVYSHTTIINNASYTKNKTVFAKGPEVKEVGKYSGQRITPLAIREHNQPAINSINNDKNELKVFKPEIRQREEGNMAKPGNTMQYKDLPHDNQQRGTWAIPEKHPTQREVPKENHKRRNRE
ncbi:MAG TPA: DUF6600 domain-containing protein [Chitinophagaceae bacterium]